MVIKNPSVFLVTRPTGIIAILFCVIIFSFLVIPVSATGITNGEFDTLDFTGWTIINNEGHIAWTSWGHNTAHLYRADAGEDPAGVWQEFDCTGYGNITFTATNKNYGDDTVINMYGDGSPVPFYSNNIELTGITTYKVDISNYSTVKFYISTYIVLSSYAMQLSGIVLSDYTASAASPEFDDVSWDQDPYYTGETANITTNILNFDGGTYSYYLDLYNTNDYLTTFELTSESESNYYTFPLGWTDTSLLAKLVRVTDPYATNEVQLAYDISHFETLDWDTTVSFNKSSYNPSDTLKVTWSGAADGSSVWLRAGDDGEVIESDVAYSGSFTFNIPANTTETYYIVDVITGGYSQVQASCMISSIPDFFFNYSVAVDQDEYSPSDIVNVTYSTDQNGQIQVVKTISDNIYHSIGFTSGAINATGLFYITEDEPYGFYDVYLLDSSNSILDSVRYALLPSTSSLEILQSSVYLHESFVVFAQTVNESILSIEDPDGIEVWNKSIDALMYDSIYYTPTIKTGVYTAYLYDDYTLSDTILVYYADDPDVPDDDVIDDVIEDILEDDESMTDYFDDKFREFAPTAWDIFLLSIILWLLAILTSFGGSGKRR